MEFTKPYKVPKNQIENRIRKIQAELIRNNIDGVFIVQRTDLFYFSGTAQNGFLYIPAEGAPLLLIKQYLPRARQESSITDIVGIHSIKDIPGLITDFHGQLPAVMGFELDVLPVNDFQFYKKLFKTTSHVDASGLILKIRQVKSEWEIEQMEVTARMTSRTFKYMRSVIQSGITEMEFSGMFEAFARTIGQGGKLRVRNYQTEGYPWHVLSGKTGSLPGLLDSPASGKGTSAAFPVGASHKKLCRNEPIMVDMGSVLNGYHMDETRMFAIESMPEKAMKACRACIEIHDAVLERTRPGVTLGSLFDLSVKMAEQLGYAENYLGVPGHRVTFIGHGIGLELIEAPFIARNREDSLETGMVFALEPKMVFENEFPAGIESVFQVTDKGARLISKVPVEIFVC
jgi:Xaa-Pro dipeptidase